jgi:hypothetical protein
MKVGGRIPITVSRPVIIQIMSGESNAIIDPDLYTAPMSILGKGWREINEVIVYQAHMSACRDRNGSDRVPMFLGVGLETFRDNPPTTPNTDMEACKTIAHGDKAQVLEY